MIRFFISKMLQTKIKIEAKTEHGNTVNRHWIFGSCHHPGCNYLSIRNTATEIHIKKQHKEMYQDIKELGWFWGTIRTIIQNQPNTIIGEALGEGKMWECEEENYHQVFMTAQAVRQHFSHMHTSRTLENWDPRMRCLNQRWIYADEEINEERMARAEQSENGQNNDEHQPAPRSIRADQIVTRRNLARRQEGQIPEQPHQENESSLRINLAQVRERK
jgi:hypothetical protein